MFLDDAVGTHFGASRLCVSVSSCSDTHLGSSDGAITMNAERVHTQVSKRGAFLSLLRIKKEDNHLFLKAQGLAKKKKEKKNCWLIFKLASKGGPNSRCAISETLSSDTQALTHPIRDEVHAHHSRYNGGDEFCMSSADSQRSFLRITFQCWRLIALAGPF